MNVVNKINNNGCKDDRSDLERGEKKILWKFDR